jgi:hypothetical protein
MDAKDLTTKSSAAVETLLLVVAEIRATCELSRCPLRYASSVQRRFRAQPWRLPKASSNI